MATTILDMEKLFQIFDNSATILVNELHISYLDALAETGDNLFEGEILQDLEQIQIVEILL